MYLFKREDGNKGPVYLCDYKEDPTGRHKYLIWVSAMLLDAKTFQSAVAAMDYIQPLIDANHPNIGNYELTQIDDDDTDTLDDAYNRAMGVI